MMALSSWSQVSELNAKLSINSSKIQGTNKEVFNTLQRALNEFINNKKWTNAKFSPNERIDCAFTMIVNTLEDNRFSCELQVQARRPVYSLRMRLPYFVCRVEQLAACGVVLSEIRFIYDTEMYHIKYTVFGL